MADVTQAAEPTQPTLGLGLGVAAPAAMMMLVQELSRRVTVVDLADASPTSPSFVRVEWSRPPEAVNRQPTVWWLDQPLVPMARGDRRRPVLALSVDPAVVAATQEQGIPTRLVPAGEVEPESAPVAPFVRERLRRARDLGEGLVLHDLDNRWWYDGREIDKSASSSALAVAAAAHVSSPENLVRAMAWGCPTAAPQRILDATGAVPGRDAVAVSAGNAMLQLRRLADDQRLTARLSTAGRLRYEEAHSLVRCVDAVLTALRLPTRWWPSALELRLHELDARRGHAQLARADEMVGAITREGS